MSDTKVVPCRKHPYDVRGAFLLEISINTTNLKMVKEVIRG